MLDQCLHPSPALVKTGFCRSNFWHGFLTPTVRLPFCLQDPDASPEATDELVTRQFKAIEAGLADACPAVRAAVVSGLCGLLNVFWELIPAAVIAGNMKRICSKTLIPKF